MYERGQKGFKQKIVAARRPLWADEDSQTGVSRPCGLIRRHHGEV
jgi:hypothetical protein